MTETLVLAFLVAVVSVAGAWSARRLGKMLGALVAALVEIGRLPDVVESLLDELRNLTRRLGRLDDRVARLETAASAVTLQADLTLTHNPPHDDHKEPDHAPA